MIWRRSLGVVAVIVAMSGSLLSSETEKRMQVPWGGLKQLAGGKQVALQLAEGVRVEGRIRKVTINSLVLKVNKSSNPAAYPKDRIEIPRETVSRVEVQGLKDKKGKRIGLTVGTFFATLYGSMRALTGGELSESEPTNGQAFAGFAISAGAAVLVYRALRPKGVTLIEILPDSPGEGVPKPANQDTSLNTTIPAGTAPLFFEPSSPGRLRQQVLQTLTRQDSPWQLSDQEPAAR